MKTPPRLPALLALLALAACACRPASLPSGVDLSFPAEQLRLDAAAPLFELLDQAGERFSLEEQGGSVVLITSIYTTCPKGCPMLLAQTRNAVEKLSPELREGLRVAAITMDPANDTQLRRAQLAEGLSVGRPPFHFLGGEPAAVEKVLDSYRFARVRDPETGLIDHAPIVLLVDREGRLAFRLSLSPSAADSDWLPQALEVLLRE